MKIELKKQTTKVTGDVYYFVTVDGSMLMGTWTSDFPTAEKNYDQALEGARLYPETTTEVISATHIPCKQ